MHLTQPGRGRLVLRPGRIIGTVPSVMVAFALVLGACGNQAATPGASGPSPAPDALRVVTTTTVFSLIAIPWFVLQTTGSAT